MQQNANNLKRIALLGATGSIGTNALRIIGSLPARCRVTGLAAGTRTALLAEQARRFRPEWLFCLKPDALAVEQLPPHCEILRTPAELCERVSSDNVDMVLCAISGTAGIKPVLSAIRAGKDIALASKEVLVSAGNIVTAAARASGSRLLPVDSEHCAVFQCLDGHPHNTLRRIILTCSGGPFRNLPAADFPRVTLEQTMKHPTWNMGPKITIDSATLMNKGLELIEAAWLFNVTADMLDVVIHPQSIVHSMVEFIDGSVLAQLGVPDMGLPIHFCLNYPQRIPSVVEKMDFTRKLALVFEPPDEKRFPALALARDALRSGGAAGAIFNASNELAVNAFVQGRLTFNRIPDVVRATLDKCGSLPADTLEEVLNADARARDCAASICNSFG